MFIEFTLKILKIFNINDIYYLLKSCGSPASCASQGPEMQLPHPIPPPRPHVLPVPIARECPRRESPEGFPASATSQCSRKSDSAPSRYEPQSL